MLTEIYNFIIIIIIINELKIENQEKDFQIQEE